MKVRALVVDDNPLDLETVKQAAKKSNDQVEIVTAATFEDGLAKLADPDGWDMAVIDFYLAGPFSGVDLAREAHCPVFIMTDMSPQQIAEVASYAGVAETIAKESIREAGAFDRMISVARDSAPGRSHSLVEHELKRQNADLQALVKALEAQVSGKALPAKHSMVRDILDWFSGNRILAFSILGVLVLAIIAAIWIGSWPG